jgi:hypothetical protein
VTCPENKSVAEEGTVTPCVTVLDLPPWTTEDGAPFDVIFERLLTGETDVPPQARSEVLAAFEQIARHKVPVWKRPNGIAGWAQDGLKYPECAPYPPGIQFQADEVRLFEGRALRAYPMRLYGIEAASILLADGEQLHPISYWVLLRHFVGPFMRGPGLQLARIDPEGDTNQPDVWLERGALMSMVHLSKALVSITGRFRYGAGSIVAWWLSAARRDVFVIRVDCDNVGVVTIGVGRAIFPPGVELVVPAPRLIDTLAAHALDLWAAVADWFLIVAGARTFTFMGRVPHRCVLKCGPQGLVELGR